MSASDKIVRAASLGGLTLRGGDERLSPGDALATIIATAALSFALVMTALSCEPKRASAAVAEAPRKPAITRTLSVYADRYIGRTMANGEPHRADRLTVASNDWPLGTRLRLSRKGRVLTVEVTDRMARRFSGRRIDASHRVWRDLTAGAKPGLARVAVEVVR